MKAYDSSVIEKKWQDYWKEHNTYKTPDKIEGKENFYALSEFAYPSGNLHVGHWYAFAVPDIFARYKRMSGYNVLYPMGFDAFGLPAENAAIKHGKDPRDWTYNNMDYMQNQLQSMGASFDWERKIMTCDPEYYRWTQWMFNQFFKNDLVHRASTKTNWCESCKTVLANEQVVDGKCERCGNQTIQKDMNQWMLRITNFADALYDDLDTLPWDHSIKQAQREWIGRKEGSEIKFKIKNALIPKEYGDLHDNEIKRNIVKVILQKDGKVLILRSKENGSMDLPGGGINENEDLIQAALRELQEETTYTNFNYKETLFEIPEYHYGFNEKRFVGKATVMIFDLVDESFSEKSLDSGEQDMDLEWMNPVDVVNNYVRNPVHGDFFKVVLDYYNHSGIKVFTTRADTLFGVTYVVLAPEHDLIQKLKPQIQNWDEVQDYLDEVAKKSDLDRQQSKEKTGVELKGITTTNPATGQEVPVWIADYVLAHFGTGAVMAVPAHDERDCEFALKYNLPFKFVVLPSAGEIGNSRQLEVFGETAGIQAAGAIEEVGQKRINAEWNYMYDILSECTDGVLPEGKRFCCTFEGKLINSPTHTNNHVFLGFNHPRNDKKWIDRKRVYAFIKQKDTDLYLGLQSLTDNTQGLVTGGVEEGENPEDSIKREVLEETGYTAKIIQKESYTISDRYYSTNKDLNINSIGDVFILEVEDINALQEIAEEESLKHKPIWLDKEQLLEFINPPSHKFIIKKYFGLIQASGNFNTQTSEESRKNITESVNGTITKTYRLRDWGISRQRYWGCPIPVVYDPQGQAHPVPDEHLPWLLPEDVDFTPDGTAPLARSEELKKRVTNIFGEGWTPEVDTMDTFVDSSWYFYRYLDPQNKNEFASQQSMNNWMPVSMYFGGAEHTTMHLLYSRFWVKALHSLGLVPANEPYYGRLNRGLILGPDGNKMSKSKGNVIDPDEVVRHVGADSVRMYLAFIGPFNEPGNYPWDPNGVVGVRRFIERVWRLAEKVSDNDSPLELQKLLHKTIKKVTDDVERLKLNTAISAMMVLVNTAEKSENINKTDYESLIKMFGVFAPHAAEELWQEVLANTESIHVQNWPTYNEALTQDNELTLGVQVNGKVRAEITISVDASESDVQDQVLEIPEIIKWIDGKEIKKFIYIPGRIINIVI